MQKEVKTVQRMQNEICIQSTFESYIVAFKKKQNKKLLCHDTKDTKESTHVLFCQLFLF